MKIKVDKKELSNALAVSNNLTKGNASLPILSNVIFDSNSGELLIKATDLSNGLICKINSGKIDQEGKFCVSCSLLLEYVQTLSSGEMFLEEKGDVLIVEQEESRARIPIVKGSEYPDFDINDKESSLELVFSELEEAIKRSLIAVSKDESRPVLEGILFRRKEESLELVGTDGYRLSVSKIESKGDWEGEMLISAKSLSSLIKGIEDENVLMGLDRKNNQAFIKTNNRSISFRLITGDYPNFERIIPDGEESKIEIGKDELSTMVSQMAVFARQNSNILKVNVGNKLKFSTQSGYVGSGEVEGDCKFSGEELEIAFNYRYLRELLAVLPEADIKMIFNGFLSPVKLSSDKIKGFLHIIMPVKL